MAKEAVYLYESKNLSDILIEVKDDETNQVRLIQIHGALVASRCIWFQRALSSGMQEAINRKVVLHDSNLNLFEMFIEYLYTGCIHDDLTNDDLVDLLTIADKYEVIYLKNNEHMLKTPCMEIYDALTLNIQSVGIFF